MFQFPVASNSTTGQPVVEIYRVINGTAFVRCEVYGVKVLSAEEVMNSSCGAGHLALFGKSGAEVAEQRNVQGIGRLGACQYDTMWKFESNCSEKVNH